MCRALILCLFAAASAPYPVVAAELKIATWNMEWFHRKANTGNTPRKSEDYAAMRRYAQILNADIIALQEVDDSAAARRVFDPNRYNFHFERRDNVQRTGFAIRKGIRFRKNPDYRELSLDDTVRRGADVTIEAGGARLRLMSVHLKSGCFDRSLDTQDENCPKLKRQLPVLERWIDDRATEETPFLVLGDFNRRFVGNDTFWPEIDDGQPPNADLSDAGAGQQSKCQGGKYPVYIDHIVLDKRAAAKLAPGSFDQLVFDAADEARVRLSDHCPISVRLGLP